MTDQAGTGAYDANGVKPWRPKWPGFVARAEHTLRISSWNAVAGVTLTITGVVADPCGSTRPFVYTHTPNTDRSRAQSIFPLEDGVLLCAQVFASAGVPLGAQCYVRLELLQGREGGTQSLGTVLAGYVTTNSPRTYPSDQVARSIDGRGTARIILGTTPGAGAEIVETVPANTRWLLNAFSFQIVTSAAAGSRVVILTIDDGVNIVWEASNNASVAPSTTAKFRAGADSQTGTIASNVFQLTLPETLILPAGARIRTVTAAHDVADAYAAPVYNVEEWIDV